MNFNDELMAIEKDFVTVCQLGSSESYEDLRLLLAKLVRKYRKTRPEFAESINSALKANRTRSSPPSILRRGVPEEGSESFPTDEESRLQLVRVLNPNENVPCPLLETGLFKQIENILLERRNRSKLAAHGVSPTRSAILVGPPGAGKTLTARWMANQLGKSLWVLDLSSVISSLLGKTGNNLRSVFDQAKQSGVVLLLDEIEAIAKRRSDDSDVGELKRLVTVILQEVDSWPESSLLLAATNHPELVDPALWRRFDSILKFDAADTRLLAEGIKRFFGQDLEPFQKALPILELALANSSMSDTERDILSLRRQRLLLQSDPVQLSIDLALTRGDKLNKSTQKALATLLAGMGIPHQQISEQIGLSRDTIRKYAGPSPIKGRARKRGGNK